jgi:hypothetical protein
MAELDPTPAPTGNEMAMSGVEGASKNMLALSNELAEISKQSFEDVTQTLEKLRNARDIGEALAIQRTSIMEAIAHAAEHTRKLGEIMSSGPIAVMKTCQEAMLKSWSTSVH